jgi:hypothetical protein
MALIPEEIINSPAYLRLPIPARQLLTELASQFRPGGGGNNGSLCLAWEAIFEPRGWKRSLYYKTSKQLAKSGFIVVTRQGGNRLATYCAIAWRDINPPMKKVGGYDPHVLLGRPQHKPWIKSIADHPTLAKKFSGTGGTTAKKDGVVSQPVDVETGCRTTRIWTAEESNVLPDNPLEGPLAEETGCEATHSKNLCHGQGESGSHLPAQSISNTREGGGPSGTAMERIAFAKAECPAFQQSDNVFLLSVVWNRHRQGATLSSSHLASEMGTAVESITVEFRELLTIGGITPAATEKRIEQIFATYGHEAGTRFMRQFIGGKADRIRAERKAARTSGAIAAAVRWFKPTQYAA